MSEMEPSARQLPDGTWVDSTGKLQWDGAAWQPIKPKGLSLRTRMLTALVVIVIVLIGLGIRAVAIVGSH